MEMEPKVACLLNQQPQLQLWQQWPTGSANKCAAWWQRLTTLPRQWPCPLAWGLRPHPLRLRPPCRWSPPRCTSPSQETEPSTTSVRSRLRPNTTVTSARSWTQLTCPRPGWCLRSRSNSWPWSWSRSESRGSKGLQQAVGAYDVFVFRVFW